MTIIRLFFILNTAKNQHQIKTVTNLRQSENFAQFMKLSGWIVEKADHCYVYIRKLPFLPPLIMKVSYPTPPIPFAQIEKLAKKYRPLKIQIQPLKIEKGFKKYGYRASWEGGHVTKTIQLDLSPSEEKIFSQMKKDARYGIRKAEKQDIKILRYKEIEAIEEFRRAWRKAVGWQRYVPSLKTLQNLREAFKKNAIFLASISTTNKTLNTKPSILNTEILAGTIILIAGQAAYYYYAFTSKEGRKNFAQYLLVWEAIRLAKKKGCQIFDFEGIYDPRFPVKSWKGFSHFKKSFGGEEIEYPRCWVRYKIL